MASLSSRPDTTISSGEVRIAGSVTDLAGSWLQNNGLSAAGFVALPLSGAAHPMDWAVPWSASTPNLSDAQEGGLVEIDDTADGSSASNTANYENASQAMTLRDTAGHAVNESGGGDHRAVAGRTEGDSARPSENDGFSRRGDDRVGRGWFRVC